MSESTIPSQLVSVVIPVRNGRDYIHECLNSILQQSHAHLEVLVIDDGSTDWDYDELLKLDPRIQVQHLTGLGVSRARNHGMGLAKGEFIAFLDADDVWYPGKLEAQLKHFNAHPEVGCVYGRFLRWHPDPQGRYQPAPELWQDCAQITAFEPHRSGWMYSRLLAGELVGMNTAVIRREVFDQLGGFDESMRIGEDYLFWLKVSRQYRMHSLDGIVAFYRMHDSSATKVIDPINHQRRLMEIAVARWGLSNPDGSKMPAQEFMARIGESEFSHGYNHFWKGSLAVAARSFWTAYRLHHRRTRSVIYLAALPGASLARRLKRA